MTGQTSRQNLWLELKQLYAAFRHSSTSSSDGLPLVASSEPVRSAISGDSNAFASLRYKCEGMASNSRKPVIGLSLGLHDFGDYAGVGHQRPLALAGGVGFTLPRVDGFL